MRKAFIRAYCESTYCCMTYDVSLKSQLRNSVRLTQIGDLGEQTCYTCNAYYYDTTVCGAKSHSLAI